MSPDPPQHPLWPRLNALVLFAFDQCRQTTTTMSGVMDRMRAKFTALLDSVKANEAKVVSLTTFEWLNPSPLLEALEENTSVTELSYRHNEPSGIRSLGVVLERNTHLVSLDVWGVALRQERVKTLAEALERNRSVATLGVRVCLLTDEEVGVLCASLQRNRAATSLDVSGNGLRDVSALCALVEKNERITSLLLRDNRITDGGATALASMLERNRTLLACYLERNDIGPAGATELAKALEKNSTLTALSLSSKPLGDAGLQVLSRALEQNLSIVEMGVDLRDFQPVSRVLGRNKTGSQALGKALLEGNLEAASRLLEGGVALPYELDHAPIFLALLKAKQMDSLEMLLGMDAAKSVLLHFSNPNLGFLRFVELVSELCKGPRYQKVLNRLDNVARDNVALTRVVGKLHCRDAVMVLWGVLRWRYRPSQQRVPLDMVNMVSRLVWQSRARWTKTVL